MSAKLVSVDFSRPENRPEFGKLLPYSDWYEVHVNGDLEWNLGYHRALILSAIHHAVRSFGRQVPELKSPHRWVQLTYHDLEIELFERVRGRTLQSHIYKLEKLGLIVRRSIPGNPKEGLYFRVNYNALLNKFWVQVEKRKRRYGKTIG